MKTCFWLQEEQLVATLTQLDLLVESLDGLRLHPMNFNGLPRPPRASRAPEIETTPSPLLAFGKTSEGMGAPLGCERRCRSIAALPVAGSCAREEIAPIAARSGTLRAGSRAVDPRRGAR